jgi:hypothetical protein
MRYPKVESREFRPDLDRVFIHHGIIHEHRVAQKNRGEERFVAKRDGSIVDLSALKVGKVYIRKRID